MATSVETEDSNPQAWGHPIKMVYRNWKGEVGERTIIPRRVWFGSTEWHPEMCWLLTAYDVDKDDMRDFALEDCQFSSYP